MPQTLPARPDHLRRATARLTSAAALVALGLGLLSAVPAQAAGASVTLSAPGSVVRGDTAVVRGKVETRRVVDLTLQGRTSRSAPWQVLETAQTSARFRFETVPQATTWYRVLATRGSERTRSRIAKVVVTEPVLRWFELYQLGTTDGDPDGFAMDGSIYAGDWHDEYGYDGFVSEVDAVDPSDWATFALDDRCVRLTGAIGAAGNDGQARITAAGDGRPSVLDRVFGPGQWQHLDVDVTGVQQLRVATERTRGGYLTSYLLGARVRCDSRLGRLPGADAKHRWRALHDLGTVDGDADGFAANGSIYSGDWHDDYGYDGFTAEVSDSDVEDWAVFRVPRGCTRLDAAVGSVYYGQADIRLTDQDGRVLHQRAHGPDQWQRLDLALKGVRQLRVTATSLAASDSVVHLLGARLYCKRR